jgi:hypothetical protein
MQEYSMEIGLRRVVTVNCPCQWVKTEVFHFLFQSAIVVLVRG